MNDFFLTLPPSLPPSLPYLLPSLLHRVLAIHPLTDFHLLSQGGTGERLVVEGGGREGGRVGGRGVQASGSREEEAERCYFGGGGGREGEREGGSSGR